MGRQFKVAVLGSADVAEDSAQGRRAFIVGREVASRKGVLLTGGCGGLPHAAALGARAAAGITVAISPAMNREEHVAKYRYPVDSDIILFTGMERKGRNVILVRSADAAVFAGGGMGTLNEFTIAFDELGPTCAIGVLEHSDGISDELAGLATLVGRSPAAPLIVESDPEKLVEMLFSHLHGL
ncbi:MAG: LOG family protein [Desulfomonile tiedjei]|nr:LOG family protein [Desulfomonile tiedjei]